MVSKKERGSSESFSKAIAIIAVWGICGAVAISSQNVFVMALALVATPFIW